MAGHAFRRGCGFSIVSDNPAGESSVACRRFLGDGVAALGNGGYGDSGLWHRTRPKFSLGGFGYTFGQGLSLGRAWSSALASEHFSTWQAKDFAETPAFPLYLTILQTSLPQE